jgi:hypothetical protein
VKFIWCVLEWIANYIEHNCIINLKRWNVVLNCQWAATWIISSLYAELEDYKIYFNRLRTTYCYYFSPKVIWHLLGPEARLYDYHMECRQSKLGLNLQHHRGLIIGHGQTLDTMLKIFDTMSTYLHNFYHYMAGRTGTATRAIMI